MRLAGRIFPPYPRCFRRRLSVEGKLAGAHLQSLSGTFFNAENDEEDDGGRRTATDICSFREGDRHWSRWPPGRNLSPPSCFRDRCDTQSLACRRSGIFKGELSLEKISVPMFGVDDR